MPPGSVIDSGAKDGGFSCYLMPIAGDRKFHAIEPLRNNVATISSRFSRCGRLDVAQCALGEHRARLDPGDSASKKEQLTSGPHIPAAGKVESREAFDVASIDELLLPTAGSPCGRGWAPGETVGLVHLDVEGAELSALRGARRAMLRDTPLLTLELHVHQNVSYTRALLAETRSLGYDCYLVEEICGLRADCRNLICLPHSRRRRFLGSPVLDLATASRKLFQVDADSMRTHAYPCCADGAECCLRGSTHRHCCTKETVTAWMRKARREHNESSLQRDPALYAPSVFFWQSRYRFPGPAPSDRGYHILQRR